MKVFRFYLFFIITYLKKIEKSTIYDIKAPEIGT